MTWKVQQLGDRWRVVRYTWRICPRTGRGLRHDPVYLQGPRKFFASAAAAVQAIAMETKQ
jgi:hypothetical protein